MAFTRRTIRELREWQEDAARYLVLAMEDGRHDRVGFWYNSWLDWRAIIAGRMAEGE